MKFEILTWESVIKQIYSLCEKIKSSSFKPTHIVTILRGGLIPARIISDCLGINRVFVVGVSFYVEVAKHAGKPVLTQPLSVNLEGAYVLLVDDVVDTGESILLAKEHILDLGAKDVKIATLHRKPWAKFEPDFFVSETDAWVVYPWEYYESIESLTKKLTSSELSEEDKRDIGEAIRRIKELLGTLGGKM